MHHSNVVEKIKSKKQLAWHEETGTRKGDKRNKTKRQSDKRLQNPEN